MMSDEDRWRLMMMDEHSGWLLAFICLIEGDQISVCPYVLVKNNDHQ